MSLSNYSLTDLVKLDKERIELANLAMTLDELGYGKVAAAAKRAADARLEDISLACANMEEKMV